MNKPRKSKKLSRAWELLAIHVRRRDEFMEKLRRAKSVSIRKLRAK